MNIQSASKRQPTTGDATAMEDPRDCDTNQDAQNSENGACQRVTKPRGELRHVTLKPWRTGRAFSQAARESRQQSTYGGHGTAGAYRYSRRALPASFGWHFRSR